MGFSVGVGGAKDVGSSVGVGGETDVDFSVVLGSIGCGLFCRCWGA